MNSVQNDGHRRAFVNLADNSSVMFHSLTGITQPAGTRVFVGVITVPPRTTFMTLANTVTGTSAGQKDSNRRLQILPAKRRRPDTCHAG